MHLSLQTAIKIIKPLAYFRSTCDHKLIVNSKATQQKFVLRPHPTRQFGFFNCFLFLGLFLFCPIFKEDLIEQIGLVTWHGNNYHVNNLFIFYFVITTLDVPFCVTKGFINMYSLLFYKHSKMTRYYTFTHINPTRELKRQTQCPLIKTQCPLIKTQCPLIKTQLGMNK